MIAFVIHDDPHCALEDFLRKLAHQRVKRIYLNCERQCL